MLTFFSCQDVYADPVIFGSCSHSFCKECILSSMDIDSSCPICRSKLSNERKEGEGDVGSSIFTAAVNLNVSY